MNEKGDVHETAIFAGGCFWGLQYYFDQMPDGVSQTSVGYIGGNLERPTYEEVCSHTTGHAEAIQIVFDPLEVSFRKLLEHFFYLHDPTQLNRQGADTGDNYRSAIFYTTDAQKETAEQYIKELEAAGTYKDPIVTQVVPATTFWPAEKYHQKYTERTGVGACHVDFTNNPTPGKV